MLFVNWIYMINSNLLKELQGLHGLIWGALFSFDPISLLGLLHQGTNYVQENFQSSYCFDFNNIPPLPFIGKIPTQHNDFGV